MTKTPYIPAYCEELHGNIMDAFHEWRKENEQGVTVSMDGRDLARIIAKAKTKLYKDRPAAKDAGFKSEGPRIKF